MKLSSVLQLCIVGLAASFGYFLSSQFFSSSSIPSSVTDDSSSWVTHRTPDGQEIRFPIIDLNVYSSNLDSTASEVAALKQRVAKQIQEASLSHGFFFVKGHGVSQELQKSVFQAARDLFKLPLESKREIPIASKGFTRGYVAMGSESGSSAYEVKEAFSYGYPWNPAKPPVNSLTGPNIWPNDSVVGEGFRTTSEDFYRGSVEVAEAIVRGLSAALGQDEYFLSQHTTHGDEISLMRMFHYFPYSHAPESAKVSGQERIGSSPHTDWGFLTLILQDEVGGLQVFHNGGWVDVPVAEDTFVVNCGDYLSLLTGGRLISPLHRVVTDERERYSMVFFYYPNYDAKIAPLANLDLSHNSNNQGYSLLSSQNEGQEVDLEAAKLNEGAKTKKIQSMAFGEYIADKWAQVYRKKNDQY